MNKTLNVAKRCRMAGNTVSQTFLNTNNVSRLFLNVKHPCFKMYLILTNTIQRNIMLYLPARKKDKWHLKLCYSVTAVLCLIMIALSSLNMFLKMSYIIPPHKSKPDILINSYFKKIMIAHDEKRLFVYIFKRALFIVTGTLTHFERLYFSLI